MRGPVSDLLFTLVAGAKFAALAAVTTVTAVAAVTTVAGTTRAILVAAIAAPHHRRGAGFMGIDADGEEPDDILVDVRLALELGDRGRRGIDVEHDVMRLAVLGDAVSEALEAPGLGLGDLALIVGEDLGGVFRERVDLGLGKVLSSEENMLVKRHA